MDELFDSQDHAESVAMFRASVVGHLACATLGRGQLKEGLEKLTEQRFRPPGADVARTYSFSTLERWYYAYKNDGLAGLKPKPRSDRGHGRALTDELKTLLCQIRKAHPSASVPLIVDTLIRQGQLDEDAISYSTVRRLFRQQGLTRSTGLENHDQPQRLRWEADAPFALWHGDVCHGSAMVVDGQPRPVRIHALLDDASRFVVAIEAHHTEREQDMLEMFADTLRRHPAPKTLYLDNGSTYSGKLLETITHRLDVGLVHATPYNPQARGKMERFWRTLRNRCLDHLGELTTLDALNRRLWAYVDEDYHQSAHASLFGKTPAEVFFDDRPEEVDVCDEHQIRQAFVARTTRRVNGDSTLSLDGKTFEIDQRFLCGRDVDVCLCVLDDEPTPYIEFEGRRLEIHPVDPQANADRERTPSPTTGDDGVDFDPSSTLLDVAVGRTPKKTSLDNQEPS